MMTDDDIVGLRIFVICYRTIKMKMMYDILTCKRLINKLPYVVNYL